MLESWESETVLDDERSGENRKEGLCFSACKLNLRLVPPKDDVRGAKTKFLVTQTGISGW